MTPETAFLDMSSAELSLALALLRARRAVAPQELSQQMTVWYDTQLTESVTEEYLSRLGSRGWIKRDRTGAVMLTPKGITQARRAFSGIVRLIDNGRGLWQVGLMWSLMGSGGPNARRH